MSMMDELIPLLLELRDDLDEGEVRTFLEDYSFVLDGNARAELLRDQAVAICERRTRELEDARAMLARQLPSHLLGLAVLGLAVLDMAAQLERLHDHPCPTMAVEPKRTTASAVAAATAELDEVAREEQGSPAAQAEAVDVFAAALRVVLVQDAPGIAPLVAGFDAWTAKIKARLDFVEQGHTWAQAKEVERVDARLLVHDPARPRPFSRVTK